MAQSPKYKVYDADGVYQASCKEPEACACLMALYGDGATIRLGHGKVVWVEGHEDQPASESWDFVAEKVLDREIRHHKASYERVHGSLEGFPL